MTKKTKLNWENCFRLIRTRYDRSAFDRLYKKMDSRKQTAVRDLESSFNLRKQILNRYPYFDAADLTSIQSSVYISGAYAHYTYDGTGSRFNDSWGVYYASKDYKTSVKEVVYHHTVSNRDYGIGAGKISYLVICGKIAGEFVDLRKQQKKYPRYYRSLDYSESQRFGAGLRDSGDNGVVYSSVRDTGGECAGVIRPRVLSNVCLMRTEDWYWDGQDYQGVLQPFDS